MLTQSAISIYYFGHTFIIFNHDMRKLDSVEIIYVLRLIMLVTSVYKTVGKQFLSVM
jgi:hypothetical protein